jgi:hypothetical protein
MYQKPANVGQNPGNAPSPVLNLDEARTHLGEHRAPRVNFTNFFVDTAPVSVIFVVERRSL